MSNLRIAMAQLNFTIGDIPGNLAKIKEAATKARDLLGAQVIVFSELALTGYPPEDLLLRSDFYVKIKSALVDLMDAVSDIYIVLGYPEKTREGGVYNAAAVIYNGRIIERYHKHKLPNYSVFDEKRYFQAGSHPCVFSVNNIKIGVIICEDLWSAPACGQAVAKGAQILVSPNASPYNMNKHARRIGVLRERIAENHVPMIYVNQVGVHDELIFDGASMALDGRGELCVEAKFCDEDLVLVEVLTETTPFTLIQSNPKQKLQRDAEVYNAIVYGLQNYLDKNNFKEVFIGVSGGIDSALTLVIAADALGPAQVTAVMMSSQYTANISTEDAKALIRNLKVKSLTVPIEPAFEAFNAMLAPAFKGLPADITEENLQARIRGIILMSLANKFKGLVLATSNKSEVAVGFSTLYGDSVGGYAVLKDVYKTMVYQLAKYRNTISSVIPDRILMREPTAELAPNQKDSDRIPTYDILDPILFAYVEEGLSPEDIVKRGFSSEVVKKVISLIHQNEYKRRQFAVGPRVSIRAFAKDWRFPISKRINHD